MSGIFNPGGSSSSSSSASAFDATIGATGADYTTISGALAASKTRLLAIDNVTETDNCAVPASGLYIFALKGVTLGMNTRQFTKAGAYNLTILSQDDSSSLTYAYSTAKNLITGTGVNKISINIVNTSTNDGTQVTDGFCEDHYFNMSMTAANQNQAGIIAYHLFSTLNNVKIIGGGSSCNNALETQINCTLTGITFAGDFLTSGGATIGSALINNIIFDNTSAMVVTFSFAQAQNIYQNNGAVEVISATSDITNCFLQNTGGKITLSSDRSRFNNIQAIDLDVSPTGSENCSFVSCRISNAVSFGGDRHKMTNCDFLGGATVVSGANDNGFSNCQFGADAGGGALTLTIDAGSNRTRVTNCMSDAVIVDNGTGSGIDATTNLVY